MSTQDEYWPFAPITALDPDTPYTYEELAGLKPMTVYLIKEQQAALAEEMKNAMPGTIVMVDDPADLPTRLAE